jgi:hypothetical protein
MSVVPVEDLVEVFDKDRETEKINERCMLEVLRKMHELMKKEIEVKERKENGKENIDENEGEPIKVLISADFKYW